MDELIKTAIHKSQAKNDIMRDYIPHNQIILMPQLHYPFLTISSGTSA
jgi:hypothetical protein